MIRKLTLVASLATLFSTALYAADEFDLYAVKLGMSLEEVNSHLQDHCMRKCMSYGSSGPAGIFDITFFLRFHTEYFVNTHRSEVNRSRPYESVTYTFGPDQKVIAMQNEFYGSSTEARKEFDIMARRYKGDLLTFTEQRQALVTAKTDVTTTHTVTLFESELIGKKFQVATWVNQLGPTTVRMNYTNFDAIRKLESATPTEFEAFRGNGVVGLTPRKASSYETANALKYKPVNSEVTTSVIEAQNTIEVISEIHDGGENPPSKLVVNGTVVGMSGLRSDGMSFEAVQQLGNGIYRVIAAWDGNGCGSQQELLLRIHNGKGYLSEAFGRCDASITKNDGTVYYSFAETEYEPALTLAIP